MKFMISFCGNKKYEYVKSVELTVLIKLLKHRTKLQDRDYKKCE
jgi:hypothetical protein